MKKIDKEVIGDKLSFSFKSNQSLTISVNTLHLFIMANTIK